MAERLVLHVADEAGVVVIDFFAQFIACNPHLTGVDDDDIVAGVHMGSEYRLVLAPQYTGDLSGESAERMLAGVKNKPASADLFGFG